MQLRVLQQSDPLFSQKTAVLTILSGDSSCEQGVEIILSASEPAAAAAVLRLGHLSEVTEPDIAGPLAQWRALPAALWEQLQKPASADNEGKVAGQLVEICNEALLVLPDAKPLSAAALESLGGDAMAEGAEGERRARARAWAAARVLLGERHALEACRDYWSNRI